MRLLVFIFSFAVLSGCSIESSSNKVYYSVPVLKECFNDVQKILSKRKDEFSIDEYELIKLDYILDSHMELHSILRVQTNSDLMHIKAVVNTLLADCRTNEKTFIEKNKKGFEMLPDVLNRIESRNKNVYVENKENQLIIHSWGRI